MWSERAPPTLRAKHMKDKGVKCSWHTRMGHGVYYHHRCCHTTVKTKNYPLFFFFFSLEYNLKYVFLVCKQSADNKDMLSCKWLC